MDAAIVCIHSSHLFGAVGLSIVIFLLILLYWRRNTAHRGLPKPWEGLRRGDSGARGYRYPFTPYATGWFVACESSELNRGKLLPLTLFGKDLVAFRSADDDERVNVLDGHCPHLGAHLGYGGKVVGNCIQCPFHAWKFNSNGKCVSIPYCDTVPKGAEIKRWKVLERNGFVLVWYEGENPEMDPFPVPVVPEVSDWNWCHFRLKWINRVHLQEMAENGLDLAHLNVVHPFEATPELQKFRMKEQSFNLTMTSPRRLLWLRDLVRIKIAFFGMGLIHATTEMRFISLRIIITHTPIDQEHCLVSIRHPRMRRLIF